MRENEFEKQVREKMEQLGFTPAESVWAGVNKEINQEKKRRIPLFWLFFVSGLLLAGSAYYFITNKNTSQIILNKNATGAIAKIPEQERNSKKQIEQPVVQSSELQKNNIKKPIVQSPEPEKKNIKRPVVQSAEPQKNNHAKNDLKTETGNEQQEFAGTGSANQNAKHARAGSKAGKKPATAMAVVITNETIKAGQGAGKAGKDDIVINNYNKKSENAETEKDKKAFDSTAGKMNAATAENKGKKDSVAGTTTAKNKEQKVKASGWEIGYTAGAGVSNLIQNLFNWVKPPSRVTNSLASTLNPGGNINSSSSEISTGFSFDAGAFVSRKLSKRLSFSAGLNYHYYSTTIQVGSKINTTLVTTNSINQTIVADSYYENNRDQTFTNQYHLIELPVSANFQLNKNKRKPFIWELGIAPAYLFSSNALYYDPNTNVYFSNYLQPNKVQINGVTALMFGFPLYDGEIQIGPQVQYGFTGFVNTNDGNPGHLFYAGLKISFIPGKK